MSKTKQYMVVSDDERIIEYGPTDDKDDAFRQMGRLLGKTGELDADINQRKLKVVSLADVRGDTDPEPMLRVATDMVDRNDRTSAKNIGDDYVEPVEQAAPYSYDKPKKKAKFKK